MSIISFFFSFQYFLVDQSVIFLKNLKLEGFVRNLTV